MPWSYVWFAIVGILGLALLVVVHESGHLLAARAFGMRVIRFSIGIGPAIWRHQPKDSETVYQIALIPFLAYVQIAGMNPLEDVDPDDKGSYANASLIGRISAIFAGPLANYLFASVLFFLAFMLGGKSIPTTRIEVMKDGAAAAAKLKNGDQIVRIDATQIRDWDQMRGLILKSAGKKLDVLVLRDGKELKLKVTPRPKSENGNGVIGVLPIGKKVPMGVGEAALESIKAPPAIVEQIVVQLALIITGKEKPQLGGPVAIVKETGRAAKSSLADYFGFLAGLSAYLGAFNLLPFPALDGGRLMFLIYEAVTRRRPNAKIEAGVHAVGLGFLLLLIAVVTVFDLAALREPAEGPAPASSTRHPNP